MMISSNFTVDDIHNIRFENYEKTKHLSHIDLIEDTNTRAKVMIEKLKEIKNKHTQENI